METKATGAQPDDRAGPAAGAGEMQRERPLLGDERLESAPPLVLDWPAGVAKPKVGLVKDSGDHPYWPKYERFLQVIPFPMSCLISTARTFWIGPGSLT